MQHRYKVAITAAAEAARERDEAVFVVQDCIDNELYAVNNRERKASYLVAEVYACVHPDGQLILNDYYVETYPCYSTL